jgi:hypothetical protein
LESERKEKLFFQFESFPADLATDACSNSGIQAFMGSGKRKNIRNSFHSTHRDFSNRTLLVRPSKTFCCAILEELEENAGLTLDLPRLNLAKFLDFRLHKMFTNCNYGSSTRML